MAWGICEGVEGRATYEGQADGVGLRLAYTGHIGARKGEEVAIEKKTPRLLAGGGVNKCMGENMLL